MTLWPELKRILSSTTQNQRFSSREARIASAEILDITEPPCKNCAKFDPHKKFTAIDDSDSKYTMSGIAVCDAPDQYKDFSCYEEKDNIQKVEPQKTITRTLNFDGFDVVRFIIKLLSLGGGSYYFVTKENETIIKFTGISAETLQKEIYDWLSVAARKANFQKAECSRRNHDLTE